ncbi:MAG: NAD(P)/FAD-dependent oxidoreductase [Syntrophales bacterium]
MAEKIRIGVLGAGFAGLYTVIHIEKKRRPGVEITLFDVNNYFLYTPVLHEVATGTVNARHVVVPIRKVVDPRRVQIRCEKVNRVNLPGKAFETPSGSFFFDRIVLAPGAETNFYGIQGARENAVTFKTIGDAILLRNRIIDILEKGAIERDSGKKSRILTINVAGGGCTGIEVVTEIAQFVNTMLKRDYPEIDRSEFRINLIEAAGKILQSFDPFLSRVAAERLKKMGIETILNSPIREVGPDQIELADGRKIPTGILIWAAGLKSRNIPLEPDVAKDSMGRIIVNNHLEIPGFPGVFAIGDGAHFNQNGGPLSPTASVAVQEARYVAEKIVSRADDGGKPFRFHYRGDMVSLGFMSGVCDIYGWKFRKSIAWFIWKVFKLAMLPKYKNRFQIMSDWLITLTFKRDTSKFI